jgi:hypothetical protein
VTEENTWKDFAINWRDRPVFEPWDLPPTRKRRKRRKPTLAGICKQARELGVDVVVAADGSMTLKCSASTSAESPAGNGAANNPWDEVHEHGTH